MAATDKVFSGSIPEMYDCLLVPLIFEFYAQDMAGRIAAAKPQRVLETAAGTGVLTRAMTARLPQGTNIVATDLNQPMLDRAASQQAADPCLTWRQADALALPFPDQAFDVVTCQFGAMFFPDKVQGFREAHRVLKPGGTFCFSVWDKIADNEYADAVTDALAAMFPADPPRFLARTPHGYCNTDLIRSQLAAAGFATIACEALDGRSPATSPRHPAIAYCQGTPLRNEIEARDAARLAEATDRAASEVARRFGTGPSEARMRAIIVTASR